MTSGGLHDPPAKRLLRGGYRFALGLHERLSVATSGRGTAPRVYYGGARPGNSGGPRVKIRRLSEAFPECLWRYNLVYLLSNAPYLPAAALRRLKGRGIPVVSNQNGVYYPAWYGGDWEAENRRMAMAYHAADHVFHQSEFCRRSAVRFLGERAGDGEVLYNAVDTARFRPAGRRRPDGRPFVFLLAGKVQAHQSYRLEVAVAGLAEARKQGLDGKLRIAGTIDPMAAGAALSLSERSGTDGSVEILGPYSQETAPALFSNADAFILTTHNDACPSSVIEAMACGLPVVYAASGGVPELVGSEAGVPLETGESWDEALMPSAADVGHAMVRVAGNLDVMRDAARARAVERFDIGHWVDRHRTIFKRLLERNR